MVASSSSLSAENNIILTENEITKNEELKFWLRCRGDSLKELKTKACLVKRVQEHITSGRDKIIVDSDPDEIYTKRKTRLSKLPTERSLQTSISKYPSDDWGNSLERMPPFTGAGMNQEGVKSLLYGARMNPSHDLQSEVELKKTLQAMDTFFIYDNPNDVEKALIRTLEVDENSINSIESTTREQSNSDLWKNESKYRFTASRFQLISKRQRNPDKFAAELIHPKSSSSRHIEHGLKYGPIALKEYEKIMLTRNTPVIVLKCGLVISHHMPILAGSFDARVADFGWERHFGLAEVKCPGTKYHATPLEACEDPSLYCKLKRDHAYFAQVQGQRGVTGTS
ncbi:hypothetical protein AWC38_SpisGene15452 [Stylophora pistillata]|uniref:YqaJ viral recombinase domain-containing protein n=1 Tax=Stylophora pistillata TaxID=50429 RepID=A0A2B4RNU8_STYPI|nr:hypothetical protein AWC38_SpisGene15452 [Stylophora pistillata]